MKRCSKSSVFKETQIKKNTIRYTSYSLGWLQSEKKKRKEQRISITSVEKIWTNWNPNTFLIGM